MITSFIQSCAIFEEFRYTISYEEIVIYKQVFTFVQMESGCDNNLRCCGRRGRLVHVFAAGAYLLGG